MASHKDISAPEQEARPGNLIRQPLKYSASLDQYRSFESTPVIGTEFPDLQVTDILNDDDKLRDLAVKVSQRGIVFFRGQQINNEQLKSLCQKLGELTGKPETSKLARHTLIETQRDLATKVNGKFDKDLWVISTVTPLPHPNNEWHTEYAILLSTFYQILFTSFTDSIYSLAYENVPPDYTAVHFSEVPLDDSGDDTLWASGYELYDRLSPLFKKMLDGQKVEIDHVRMRELVQQGYPANLDRGAPGNSSVEFKATHPIVRTNPVTGWKSLFGVSDAMKAGSIKGVTEQESDVLNKYFSTLIAQNHDLHVRFRWRKGDMALWDSRSIYHTGTDDQVGRLGHRVMSIGEVPYYDPASISRREALAHQA
ncbi:unnamed protein product [Clonostachys chloroleuca]|uniref:TauD/TfdA-like domain-containing protein n=1 Tax=Clonostachys chloroleuca TaxID=1926264 RepID=A0AA35LTW0_9HYPO|nr:unnamed protein product [Clonostachys chloroleuca]